MLIRNFIAVSAIAVTFQATAANAEHVLRWGGARDIYSLDPYSLGSTSNLAFLNHIYEGLVRYRSGFEVEPAPAKSWEFVAPSTWRFHLREGVKFQDGSSFTAADVIASMERVNDLKSPLRGNIPTFVKATKVNDMTVDIETTSASPLFPRDMTYIFMFDAGWLKSNDAEAPTSVGAQTRNYATYHTNGAGPFELESRVPDAKTVLVVNRDWWDTPKHNLNRIEFTPITSAAIRVSALLSGEIDLTDSMPVQDLARLKANPSFKLIERSDLRTVRVSFNRRDKLADGRDNPFNNLRLRQAIDMTIDRNLIGKRIMRGMVHVAGTVVAPEIPGCDKVLDTATPYDPQKAKELIAEGGFEGIEFTLTCTNDETVNEEAMCQAVVSMLTRVGLKPKLDIGPRAVQSPKRSSGKAGMFITSWANEPTLDSYSILAQVLSTREGAAGVANYGGWSYPEIDQPTEKVGAVTDNAKRIELEKQTLKIVKDQVVLIPLYQQPMAWAMNDKITDITVCGDNELRHWLTRMAD